MTILGGKLISFLLLAVLVTVQSKSKVREFVAAAGNGETEKVLEILNHGVKVDATFDPDESEFSGMTALMAASLRGHSETVDELIKRGANVNLKRYSGETPLRFAAMNGHVKIVKALLRAGADPNVKVMSPHAGEITPLTSAINSDSANRVEIAHILIQAKAQINPTGTFFVSPLMHAVNDLEMVKLLIDNGAEVNQKNFRGATALMGAAVGAPASVVRYLIDKGADVNARDKDGYTALQAAEEQQKMSPLAHRQEVIEVLKAAQSRPRQ